MTRRGIVACLLLGLLGMASGEARQQRRPTAEPPPEPQTAPAPETDAQAPGVRSGETVEVADGQVPVFRSGINYVRVDAFVTDGDDNPVFDLTQDDFEVYEDGVLQDVDSFDVVRVDPLPTLADEPLTRIGFRRSDQERAASRPDVRVFVILPRRLPRAFRQRHPRPPDDRRVPGERPDPDGPRGGDVPADAARRSRADAQSRSGHQRRQPLRGRQVRVRAPETNSRRDTPSTRCRSSSGSGTTCRCRRCAG